MPPKQVIKEDRMSLTLHCDHKRTCAKSSFLPQNCEHGVNRRVVTLVVLRRFDGQFIDVRVRENIQKHVKKKPLKYKVSFFLCWLVFITCCLWVRILSKPKLFLYFFAETSVLYFTFCVWLKRQFKINIFWSSWWDSNPHK